MEGGKFMSEKQRGKKYLKTDNRSNIKKSLQKMLNMVINDELDTQKANTMCRIIDLQLKIIDEELQEQLDQLSEQINRINEEGR